MGEVSLEGTDEPSHDTAHHTVLRIGCDDCAMSGTAACDDCLVTFVHTHGEPVAVVLDLEEHRALRRLQSVGLVPANRHVQLGVRR
jgi:hypothetical protein